MYKYLLFTILTLELITAISLFGGDEYPENIIGSFILFVVLFLIVASMVMLSRSNLKWIKPLSLTTTAVLLLWISWILYIGQEYFFLNWKGMTSSEYKYTITFSFLAAGLQLIQVFLVSKNRLPKYIKPNEK